MIKKSEEKSVEKNEVKSYDELNELYGRTIILSEEVKSVNYIKYGVIDGEAINTNK
jgi:UTP-glucose-1-phosphate uridylyltransferase